MCGRDERGEDYLDEIAEDVLDTCVKKNPLIKNNQKNFDLIREFFTEQIFEILCDNCETRELGKGEGKCDVDFRSDKGCTKMLKFTPLGTPVFDEGTFVEVKREGGCEGCRTTGEVWFLEDDSGVGLCDSCLVVSYPNHKIEVLE
jgi:hypothetical protein